MSGFSRSNANIIRGTIYDSNVDMNGRIITNHQTPISNLDVVNKHYCDNNRTPLQVTNFEVLLEGTDWTSIINATRGNFEVSVVNVVEHGPCAVFVVTKNHPSRSATSSRWSSVSGTTTQERLEIRWPINGIIQIRKTGIAYDGLYSIKYQL